MSSKCSSFVFCSNPSCRKFHHLNMNFKDRMEAKKLRSSSNLKIITETYSTGATGNQVIYCENNVSCKIIDCPFYHGGFAHSSRIQLCSLIFRECLESEFVPSPPRCSPKFSPSPRRKFLKS